MKRRFNQWIVAAACGIAVLTCTHSSRAHFLWIKTVTHENQPHAFLFFGEDVADEAYHLPERLADAELWLRTKKHERSQLKLKNLETDDRTGLVAPIDKEVSCVLETTKEYGIYGKSLLVYYAKHVRAASANELNSAGPSKKLNLDIVPTLDGETLTLTTLWQSKPLAGAKVKIAVGDSKPVEKTTDDDGQAAVKLEGNGLVAVLTSRIENDKSGELGEQTYEGVMHYASLTFERPQSGRAPATATSAVKPRAEIPTLPEPLSSFGAAIADGWLYVYGGHIGGEHEHSAANLSQHFRRLRLDHGTEWEDLPMPAPLQGLAFVAHEGKLYRIGGLEARNPTTKDKEDLHSTAEFAQFDPARRKWMSLAPLPAPRSSHNAVVIGDRLYVVGGWQLAGRPPGNWQTTTLLYDFAAPKAGWRKAPAPPFQRRALAVSHWHGKLAALGGMDDEGRMSHRVDLFDPHGGDWSEGPELPGTGMTGFGISAWNLHGQLYVSGLDGIVYRLDDTGSAWEEAARLAKPRFFHQLVPAGEGALLAVGGASRKGHLADIEWIDVSRRPAKPASSVSAKRVFHAREPRHAGTF